LKPFWVSLILFFAACAPARIAVPPSFEGKDLGEFLAERGTVSGIETRFGILFERNEAETRGDAALAVSKNGDMNLRVYSLGFLAMELISANGVTKSSPHLEGNRKAILTRGLRDCLFWWDVPGGSMSDEGDSYLLSAGGRRVWIDKRTFLPIQQRIRIEEDRELIITYGAPAEQEGFWYPSKIRIELMGYSVTLSIREMALRS